MQTGQLVTGPVAPRTPEDPQRQLAALRALRPPAAPFVLRLHRYFWSDGDAATQRFLKLARRYAGAGFDVELQLRYHPSPAQEGDIGAWERHVRDVVDRFGAIRRVVAIQVTNEINLAISPDSSDGAYRGGTQALVRGVIAAKDEARRRGYAQLKIGFNWAYRADPLSDGAFWDAVRDGGPALRATTDWIGLDAYPGTLFPPVQTDQGRGGLINALSTLRCYARGAGIPDATPIHVEENGWPTNAVRTEAQQAATLRTMVSTVDQLRGTFNVSDYRWFNLRDGDSTSQNFQVRYGLLRDDYSPKPAFAVYRDLMAALTRPPARATRAPSRTRPRRG